MVRRREAQNKGMHIGALVGWKESERVKNAAFSLFLEMNFYQNLGRERAQSEVEVVNLTWLEGSG